MCSVADGFLCRVCAFVGRANVNKMRISSHSAKQFICASEHRTGWILLALDYIALSLSLLSQVTLVRTIQWAGLVARLLVANMTENDNEK